MYQQNAGTFWQADPQQIFHEEVVLLKGRIFKNWQQNSTLPFSRQTSYLMQVLRKWRNKLILKSTITSNIWYENFIFNPLQEPKY